MAQVNGRLGVVLVALALGSAAAMWVMRGLTPGRRLGPSQMARNRGKSAVGAHQVLKQISSLKGTIALDMGGTLCKLVYLHPMDSPPNVLVSSRFYGETGERVIDLQWASKVCQRAVHEDGMRAKMWNNGDTRRLWCTAMGCQSC